ncbi:MAG: outer membrane protein assembly factor BamB [Verrucomicrobiales bacterium]|jgi:outer membrane protein assembly factor BamB
MNRVLILPLLLFANLVFADEAQTIFDQSGIRGGLVLHLGCGEGALTSSLGGSERYQVHALAASVDDLRATRARLVEGGVYGQVTADLLEGSYLPFVDNLVNLIVVENLNGLPMEEVIRVLCPDGVAMVKGGDGAWQKTIKTRTDSIDEWTHYFHGADGNAVAQDDEVGPPTRLAWLGSPRWSRHHDRMASMSALVTGGGRLFYIMDEGSRISIQLPSKWKLVARDAFNGVILWKKPIEKWHDQLWPLKSGPTQLAKRLVTSGDRVFVPLALNAPVSCLDAATGDVLWTYEDQAAAEEMVLVDGVLYVVVNRGVWALEEFNVKMNTGDQGRVAKEFAWDKKPRELHAISAADGKRLWKKETKVAPLSLVANQKQVVFHDGEAVVSLNPGDGQQQWRNDKASRRSLFEFNYGPRLVVQDKVVLYAGGDGKKMGLDAASGDTMWSSEDPRSGYRSPQDLLVSGGLLWSAPLTQTKDTGIYVGRDPVSGEVKKQFPPTVETYWFHHRCYIAKATEKFLMPSRTGIEFIDHEKEEWDINHWVRGGCLYGVLPANGLTYAPPHNCACYPEAKLYGFNALAATGSKPVMIATGKRLERGPAYADALGVEADVLDWPTYRHDVARSGSSGQELGKDLGSAWEADLGGRLSALTIADGKVFVSQIDAHTVHALAHKDGKRLWHFIAGARVDSPPTFWKGRVLFGCSDGNVYCLRASDGELVWRFRAAPGDRRTMVFEQLESLWPVPGSVLVEDGVVSFVAGRSAFLDGGMLFYRLDAATGRVLVHKRIDDRDPESGGDLQDRIQTLQMPVALNDILSSDGKLTYLRSQKIEKDGERIEIGPVSGNPAAQGAKQAGEGAHVFAPMGFLDDTWFHRSYWVYGRNFAGGHGGYHQAGKYAPSGRILVFNDDKVFGYGREPKYYKWTTTLEHQLFSASREIPDLSATVNRPKNAGGKRKVADSPVVYENTERINPAGKALTVEAWVMPDQKNGVVVAHGGPANGYALVVKENVPQFDVRSNDALSSAVSTEKLGAGWKHLVAVLAQDGTMVLYVDGEAVGTAKSPATVATQPLQTLELGGDSTSTVGEYPTGASYSGLIDEFALYHRAFSADEVRARFEKPAKAGGDAVIASSFDGKGVGDDSEGKNTPAVANIQMRKGVVGDAIFIPRKKVGKKPKMNLPASKGSFVQHDWTGRVPMYTRAMALAGDTLIIAGPPDIIDEEYTFGRLAEGDKEVHKELAAQDAALEGKDGGIMQTVSTKTGEQGPELKLESLPVWDGMAIARGRLFVASKDGKVRCFGRADE